MRRSAAFIYYGLVANDDGYIPSHGECRLTSPLHAPMPEREPPMSLSRDFAGFVAGLRYEDLPPAVIDRSKGVTLQALASAMVAHDMSASGQALALMQEEEQGGGGAATVL